MTAANPVRLAPSWWRRGNAWTDIHARVLTYSLVALQLLQGFARFGPGNPNYNLSYWAVDYSQGFIRRGLGGEVVRLATGRVTASGALLASGVVAVIAVASVLVLVEALLRHGRVPMALLLAASPFTFDILASQRRPDLLAVPLLVGIGFALRRPAERRAAPLALLGVGLAVATLVHEGVLLFAAPWAMALALHAGTVGSTPVRQRSRVVLRSWAMLLGPGVATAAVVAAIGATTPETARVLFDQAPWLDPGSFDGTVLLYLSDSIGLSMERVGLELNPWFAVSILIGAALTAAQLWWLRRWTDGAIEQRLASAPRDLRRAVVAIGTAVALFLFLTGHDWLRWFPALGCGWLITCGFVSLGGHAAPAPGRADERGPGGRASTATRSVPETATPGTAEHADLEATGPSVRHTIPNAMLALAGGFVALAPLDFHARPWLRAGATYVLTVGWTFLTAATIVGLSRWNRRTTPAPTAS